jgi:hypothetical protein
MESPYNHWKYLTPLSVTTKDTTDYLSDNHMLMSKEHPSTGSSSSTSKVIEPVSITSA